MSSKYIRTKIKYAFYEVEFFIQDGQINIMQVRGPIGNAEFLM